MTYFSCFYNYAPQFTNLVQGAKLSVYENSTFVYDINAKDSNGDSFSYSICGGDDADFFTIDPKTGMLSFKSSMDYENPLSKSGDNVYEVTIKVKDCYGAYSLRTIQVEVCDVKDAPDTNGCIVLEAEDFYSVGFKTACAPNASDGEIVKLACDSGAIATHFEGDSGKYKLSLFAQDENDGVSKLLVYVGGKLVDTVYLDKQTDGCGDDAGQFSEIDLGEIDIANGDLIYIEAYRNGGEYVRIDKLCLQPVSEACTETVTIAAENFEGGTYGWNTCKTAYDSDLGKFLGTFGKCEYPSKTFAVPADAESVKVGFDLYVIDSWDGEHMYVKVEDTIVDLGSFGWWFAVGSRSGECGGIKFTVDTVTGPTHLTGQNCADYFKDQVVHVTLEVPADKISGNDLTLTFGASLDEDRSNESFGIDNLLITAEVPCDADPADAVVGGRYFVDADGDNTEWNSDANTWENGVANATVYLIQNGEVVATTKTDGYGTYQFTGLKAGTYAVSFEDPESAKGAGYVFVESNVGDDGADSDVVTIAGKGTTATFEVGESCTVWNVDAGIKDPATAEIGNLAFLDVDKDGVYTAGIDQAKAGVEVTLYDGTGNVVATTTTLADGSYRFSGLTAGSYQVGFAAIAGLAFTLASQAAADAVDNDSDANILTGLTDVFDLAIGEVENDIDAGYATVNTAPYAGADSAATCANEPLVLSLLDNDGDADGDSISLVSIAGQSDLSGPVSVSGTATVTGTDGSAGQVAFSGLTVTLADGSVTIDGDSAFEFLGYGETATVTISYGISDGQGGTAEGALTIEFCGAAETLEEIDATLPSLVTYQIASAVKAYDGVAYQSWAYDMKMSATGDARLDGVVFTEAYCLSYSDPVSSAASFDTAALLTGNLYTAASADLPDNLFNAGQIGSNGEAAADNLDLITYILNQDYEDQGYTGWEVQFAIWSLTDNFAYSTYTTRYPSFGDAADVADIVADAVANGEGFEAGEGDIIALIIDPNPETATNGQPFIVGAEFDSFDCMC
ncbi:SdrD B-like domain-containing protein [Mangrovicoccus sp. HB161399]|uniref:SdrD B-like domain-containing protein n=1 Tax=Mangrovicoccus sp. HB161399 TaxID=2720392 RepID=UPI0015558CAD|nr:SdrD B-like domain-containing protein [Mangrovicoccus sp. HB161399]